MAEPLRHRKEPCPECPFRLDTDPGQFPAERYEALQSTVGRRGEEKPYGAPMFACHKSAEGKEIACAGWLAVCGVEHIGVRIAVAHGRLPAETLQPRDDWPELFDNYDEMAERQGGSDECSTA